MKYVCNHCQHSAEIDIEHTDPIPCGICGQGVFVEEEKYRTEYCYTRKDVAMMNLDRGDEVERLREAIKVKDETLERASAQLRIAYNYYKIGAEYRITADHCIEAVNAGKALNAEQGGE